MPRAGPRAAAARSAPPMRRGDACRGGAGVLGRPRLRRPGRGRPSPVPGRCAAAHRDAEPVLEVPQVVIARVHGLATAAGWSWSPPATSPSRPSRRGSPCRGARVVCYVIRRWWRWPRQIGRKRALEMGITGDPIYGGHRRVWGLVNRVVARRRLDVAVLELMGRSTAGARWRRRWASGRSMTRSAWTSRRLRGTRAR